MEYYGEANLDGATVAFVVQPHAAGLCDAIFRAAPLVSPGESVCIGLPDTIWFPKAALCQLLSDILSFLLFPVERPELFDAVVLDGEAVREIQVKRKDATSLWIWGAFRMPCSVFSELRELWDRRDRADEYFGTLVNAYLAAGGTAVGVKAGQAYVDVGTLHGYRTAMALLADMAREPQSAAELPLLDPHSSPALMPRMAEARS